MSEFTRDPFRARKKPSKSEAFYVAWGKAHEFCAACGRDGGAFGLQTHHIIKQGRAHEAANLLRLCGFPCHPLAEGLDVRGPAWTHRTMGRIPGDLLPKITLGIALSMKLRADRDEVDLDRLMELRGAALPAYEPIPQYFVDLWRRNRPEVTNV